jgi:hypothetical protein
MHLAERLLLHLVLMLPRDSSIEVTQGRQASSPVRHLGVGVSLRPLA